MRTRSALRPFLRVLSVLVPGLAVAAFAIALWLGTHRVGVRNHTVPIPGLPAGQHGLRVLHVSDLHTRSVGVRERRLARLARRLAPQLIAVTGDLTEPGGDGRETDLGPPVSVMRELASIAPTLAVLGNNDYSHPRRRERVDTEQLVRSLEEAGVVVLRNRAVVVSGLYVVGLEDNFTHRDDLHAALRGVPDGAPAVLLAHSPDVVLDWDASRFGVVLAGHTHGGQIRLPFVGALETQTRAVGYVEGLYRLPEGNWLHVSAGIGTSGIHVRFLALPAMTVLTLVRPLAVSRLRYGEGGP